MSLRQVVAMLSDDRETLTATRDVIAYFDRHRDQRIAVPALERATGVPSWRLARLLDVLTDAHVLDCDGDVRSDGCVYHPDTALDLEVRRFLRAAVAAEGALQRKVDRFRERFGSGH